MSLRLRNTTQLPTNHTLAVRMAYQVGDHSVGIFAGAVGNGDSNGQAPEASLHTTLNVTVSGLNLREQVAGLLTITGENLRWSASDGSGAPGSGLLLPFRSISLHAVSRDPSSGLPPCIYAQVGEEDDELRIFPSQVETELDPLFAAMCDAAAMCSGEEEEEEDTEDQVGEMYMAGGVRARLEDLLEVPEHLANGSANVGSALEREEDNYDVCEALDDCRFEDATEDGANGN